MAFSIDPPGFYLVERRNEMLPPLLTSNLCSLVEGQDRLAFSVLFLIDEKGFVIKEEFQKTIINSRKTLTYQQAQDIIDDPTDQSELAEKLRLLLFLGKQIRKRRKAKGALELASADVQIIKKQLQQQQQQQQQQQGAAAAEFAAAAATAEGIDVALYQARETNKMFMSFHLFYLTCFI
ncbi:mitotic control protein dis3, putative [Eimeria tenella]|uniref:Mitotic control protein dis3, putative n=1 Tax=Eimeria tenella TaxID=5802 RepID=U6KVV7_EIMTE|nr:mitotic control protein dis3, putative [Eimeria tenella]CDJ39640.1 mitotic control protein dis3, putative [Eimeria tenella]|eukprot:XP_013230395.1 mitotic control protein dis3, putative [Eimeria tenella]